MEELAFFVRSLGPEVEDAEEESFLLFSQEIPSSNLGFVDSRATSVDITIHGEDYSIHQSPTLLSSSRAGGTTGAVLWKITPLFAEWISSLKSNPLWTNSLLSSSSTVVELGCGISALTALTLSPLVEHYIATDQEYVRRIFRENLDSNPPSTSITTRTQSTGPKPKGKKQQHQQRQRQKPTNLNERGHHHPNITFSSLDWELDIPDSLKDSIELPRTTGSPRYNRDGGRDDDKDDQDSPDKGFDLLLSCDCIYNEALVAPFVRTCADICRLRPVYTSDSSKSGSQPRARSPTMCIIAQQQRSPDVFEAWLLETLGSFRVWRLSDEALGGKLKLGTGYLVHLLLLRED